jgi:hypothetical protein
MAVIITASNPTELLASIKAGMESGSVTAWICDSDGDFTLSTPSWTLKAWLRPRISEGKLVLNILPPRHSTMSKGVYAAYHARFIEMLLTAFDGNFTDAKATALPIYPDLVKAE